MPTGFFKQVAALKMDPQVRVRASVRHPDLQHPMQNLIIECALDTVVLIVGFT